MLNMAGLKSNATSMDKMVKFWNQHRNQLCGKQMVILSSLRMDVLHHLQDGHQGIITTRENINLSVWWP